MLIDLTVGVIIIDPVNSFSYNVDWKISHLHLIRFVNRIKLIDT